ncbi:MULTISPECIES: TlpA disulfide reductase family protein [Legionella]|uniref:Thiol-disulfide oxidoreductase ResA n=1 Tax=Legionella drozanskii LLAP-1 TaxID=1212489 RepID=A0A0W0SP14_9GAMM|nr:MULTISPECIES: TlpA disulfide reductase family protein [Legionella]KTC84741.1 thiol-disulfide oxidoreductase ResA [Legionella drozanskii LLAP-1]PJE18487.1 MAG: TlpA family protein disulfide reductase [Legionella sp.]
MQRLKLILSSLFCLLIISNSYSSNAILKDIRGQSIPFDSLKGKWVLINYWANWCQPCLDEIAELNRFYKINSDRVALFAVNYDSPSLTQQIALVRKYHINYPSLRYNPARDLKIGDIRGVPATFVFNPKGQFKGALYGEQTLKSLNKATTG